MAKRQKMDDSGNNCIRFTPSGATIYYYKYPLDDLFDWYFKDDGFFSRHSMLVYHCPGCEGIISAVENLKNDSPQIYESLDKICETEKKVACYDIHMFNLRDMREHARKQSADESCWLGEDEDIPYDKKFHALLMAYLDRKMGDIASDTSSVTDSASSE